MTPSCSGESKSMCAPENGISQEELSFSRTSSRLGGVSAIRHYLIGKQYFRKKFGKEPTTAYNFDTFGHPQGLIQILAGCGMDSYVFCRPNHEAIDLPSALSVGSTHLELRSSLAAAMIIT